MSRFGSFFFVWLSVGWHKEGADGITCFTLLVRASHGESLQTVMFDMLVQTWKKTSHAPTIGKHLVSSRLEGGPCNPEETMFQRTICLHNAVLRLVHGVATELARREL